MQSFLQKYELIWGEKWASLQSVDKVRDRQQANVPELSTTWTTNTNRATLPMKEVGDRLWSLHFFLLLELFSSLFLLTSFSHILSSPPPLAVCDKFLSAAAGLNHFTYREGGGRWQMFPKQINFMLPIAYIVNKIYVWL